MTYYKPTLLGHLSTGLIGPAFVAMLVFGCGDSSQAASGSGTPSGGLHIASEGLAPPFDNPTDMCTATLVAVGSVVGFGSSHWNTADGLRPMDASFKTVATNGYLIYTPVNLSLSVIPVDHRTSTTREFDVMGGQVGNDSYRAAAFDQPVTGRQYLLVLFPGIDGSRAVQSELSMVVYRAFPIIARGVELRPKLVEQGNVSQQELVMPLPSILQQLAACK